MINPPSSMELDIRHTPTYKGQVEKVYVPQKKEKVSRL
jgi:hypothetical protein